MSVPTIDVLVDGSCKRNGERRTGAGFSVFLMSSSGPVERSGKITGLPQTNNIAELFAIYKGLLTIRSNHSAKYVIWTDSEYAFNCLTRWVPNWQTHNWVTTEDKPVKNGRFIKTVYDLFKATPNAQLQLCRGHSGTTGNVRADYLARQGADGNGQHNSHYSDPGKHSSVFVYIAVEEHEDQLGASVFYNYYDSRNRLYESENENYVEYSRSLAMYMDVASRALRRFMDNPDNYANNNIQLMFDSDEAIEELNSIMDEWADNDWCDDWGNDIHEAPTYHSLYRRITSLKSLGFTVFWSSEPGDEEEENFLTETTRYATGVSIYGCNAEWIDVDEYYASDDD